VSEPAIFNRATGEQPKRKPIVAALDAIAALARRVLALEQRKPAGGEPGKDGRGIAALRILDGRLVATFSDNVESAIGDVPPGPVGERGPQGEKGERGRDGKDGKDGRDGTSVSLQDVLPVIREAVAAIPVPKDGRDGIDGKDGADGARGRDGIDGKDGRDGRDADPEQLARIETEIAAIRSQIASGEMSDAEFSRRVQNAIGKETRIG